VKIVEAMTLLETTHPSPLFPPLAWPFLHFHPCVQLVKSFFSPGTLCPPFNVPCSVAVQFLATRVHPEHSPALTQFSSQLSLCDHLSNLCPHFPWRVFNSKSIRVCQQRFYREQTNILSGPRPTALVRLFGLHVVTGPTFEFRRIFMFIFCQGLSPARRVKPHPLGFSLHDILKKVLPCRKLL